MPVRALRRSVKLAPREGEVQLSLLDFGGSGPLALLHHANGFCGALWEPVALRLRERYRVIAFDARGHGDSSSPPPPTPYAWNEFALDLLALADQLAREGLGERIGYGIGHSFGGTLMAVCAARSPERFERLGLVDPVLFPPSELLVAAGRDEPGPTMAERARSRRASWPSRAAVREAWSRGSHPFSVWDARARDLYVEEGLRDGADGGVWLKCAREIEAAIFENNRSLDAFALAARITAPTLIVRAARGGFPRPLYDAFAARLPRAEIKEVDAGHLIPMEAPAELADRLLAFGTT